MFCQNCGTSIPEGASVCPNCGTQSAVIQQQPVYQQPVYQQPVQQPVYQQPVNGQPVYAYDPMTADVLEKARKAKTLGIVGMCLSWLSPLVAWICGGIAVSRANKGLAISEDPAFKTSKTCGIIAVVLGIVFFLINFVVSMGSTMATLSEMGAGTFQM